MGEDPKSTLRQVQSIDTLPSTAYPRHLNTCGRIAVSPTGDFVLVSNRGHDSIVVYNVNKELARGGAPGRLTASGFFHTQGQTPRHFQFDQTGKWLLSANQDSDNVSIFRFNPTGNGDLIFERSYEVPSPNFITSFIPHNESLRRGALAHKEKEAMMKKKGRKGRSRL